MTGGLGRRPFVGTWEVAVGPRDQPRYFHVPDEDLHRFVRSLASRGVAEIQISNGRQVYRINRLLPRPSREPAPTPAPTATPAPAPEPDSAR